MGKLMKDLGKKLWLEALWNAMASSGRGYRKHSMRHTGVKGDRRSDKLLQDGREGYILESKLERRARQQTLGVRV